MRKAVASMAAFALLMVGSGVYGQQPPTDEKEKPKTTPAAGKDTPARGKPGQPAAPSPEEMLTKALKDNPDIRVAEAKLREADAELNRVRLQVTQKVIAFHRSLEAQKGLVELAEKDFKRVQNLFEQGRVDQKTTADAQ